MASPISIYLRNLRLRIGITQRDLAHSMGYEQAYLSSLELGTKNPSKEFLDKLISATELSDRDRQELDEALKLSKQRYKLTSTASPKTYEFVSVLWDRLERLHPALLDAMLLMLHTGDQVAERPRHQPTRLKRRPSNAKGEMKD
jgi:transcriptional regulator with XRE-family HTH domain